MYRYVLIYKYQHDCPRHLRLKMRILILAFMIPPQSSQPRSSKLFELLSWCQMVLGTSRMTLPVDWCVDMTQHLNTASLHLLLCHCDQVLPLSFHHEDSFEDHPCLRLGQFFLCPRNENGTLSTRQLCCEYLPRNDQYPYL
jgi:hypothetical protein